jgi:hypothetical protein
MRKDSPARVPLLLDQVAAHTDTQLPAGRRKRQPATVGMVGSVLAGSVRRKRVLRSAGLDASQAMGTATIIDLPQHRMSIPPIPDDYSVSNPCQAARPGTSPSGTSTADNH